MCTKQDCETCTENNELLFRQQELIDMQDKVLRLYYESMNQIDDYFEYNYNSERDKENVYAVLNDLYSDLVDISKELSEEE